MSTISILIGPGSDVVEKIKYYMRHEPAAIQIANNGRKLWEEYSMLDEQGLLPLKVRTELLKNIYQVSGYSVLSVLRLNITYLAIPCFILIFVYTLFSFIPDCTAYYITVQFKTGENY
jgi:hypothetical protein